MNIKLPSGQVRSESVFKSYDFGISAGIQTLLTETIRRLSRCPSPLYLQCPEIFYGQQLILILLQITTNLSIRLSTTSRRRAGKAMKFHAFLNLGIAFHFNCSVDPMFSGQIGLVHKPLLIGENGAMVE